MVQTQSNITQVDPVWDRITQEARQAVADEPLMGGFIMPVFCTTRRSSAR